MNEIDHKPRPFTSKVQLGINEVWATSHPELFGKAILELLRDHPLDEWKVTIRAAYMPGEKWEVTAARKTAPGSAT